MEELLDRLRAEAFLAEYARCIDDDRLEEWPSFFTEDCHYGIYSRENHDAGLPIPLMLCIGRAMLEDRVLSRREANIFAPHVYRHFTSALRVTREAGGLRLLSNYLVVQTLQDGESHIYQAGRAFDWLVGTAEGWRLAERRVIYDTSRIQTLLTTPI